MLLLIGIFSVSAVVKWKGRVLIALIDNISSIVKELISQAGLIILIRMLIKHPDMAKVMEYINEIKKLSDKIKNQQYEEKKAEESPPACAKNEQENKND